MRDDALSYLYKKLKKARIALERIRELEAKEKQPRRKSAKVQGTKE